MKKFFIVVLFLVFAGCSSIQKDKPMPINTGLLIAPGPVCFEYHILKEIVRYAERTDEKYKAYILITEALESGKCSWYTVDDPVLTYVIVEKIDSIVKVHLTNPYTGVIMRDVWVYTGNLKGNRR